MSNFVGLGGAVERVERFSEYVVVTFLDPSAPNRTTSLSFTHGAWDSLMAALGLTKGVLRIATERMGQIAREGYTAAHDDAHGPEELVQAAIAYAQHALEGPQTGIRPMVPTVWPWDPAYWKPRGPVRDLERAGALIAAELDRMERSGEVHES